MEFFQDRRVLYDLDKFSINVASSTEVFPRASLFMERSARETSYSIEAAESRTNFNVWNIEVTYLSETMMKFMKVPELPQQSVQNCSLKFPARNDALSFFNEHIRENLINLLVTIS